MGDTLYLFSASLSPVPLKPCQGKEEKEIYLAISEKEGGKDREGGQVSPHLLMLKLLVAMEFVCECKG